MNKLQYIKLLELRGIKDLHSGQSVFDAVASSGGGGTQAEMVEVNELVSKHYMDLSDSLTNINKGLENQITSMREKISGLEKENEELLFATDNLEIEPDSLRAEISGLEKKVEAIKKYVNDMDKSYFNDTPYDVMKRIKQMLGENIAKMLQEEMQSLISKKAGICVCTCGMCGKVMLYDTDEDEVQCPHCDYSDDPCHFPDLFYPDWEK